MKRKVIKKLKENISEFNTFSGCPKLSTCELKDLTENLDDKDLDEINNAFTLLTAFYAGAL